MRCHLNFATAARFSMNIYSTLSKMTNIVSRCCCPTLHSYVRSIFGERRPAQLTCMSERTLSERLALPVSNQQTPLKSSMAATNCTNTIPPKYCTPQVGFKTTCVYWECPAPGLPCVSDVEKECQKLIKVNCHYYFCCK